MKTAPAALSFLLAACVNAAAEAAPVEVKLTGLVLVEEIKMAVFDVSETDLRNRTRVNAKFLKEGERSGTVEVVSIDGRDGNVVIRNDGRQTLLSFDPSPALKPAASATGTVRFQNLPLESLLPILSLANHRTLLRASTLPGVKLTGQREGLDAQGFASWIEELLRESGLALTPSGDKFMFLTTEGQAIPSERNATSYSPPGKMYSPTALRFTSMPLEQFLEFYGEVAGRSVLRPSSLPGATITLRTETAMSQTELVYALESVLQLNGVKTTPRGDKFVIVTETSAPAPIVAQVNPITSQGSNAQKNYDSNAIRFQAMPLARFLEFYQAATGRSISMATNLPSTAITFRSSTALTQTELTEAFDTLLALNGIQVTDGTAGQWQISPLARAAKP